MHKCDAYAERSISDIVTSDAHFLPLIGSGYKPQPITPEQFIVRFLVAKP